MNLPIVCENCRAELNAKLTPGGISVEVCECQKRIECDVCEVQMNPVISITDAMAEGWKELDRGIWLCPSCNKDRGYSDSFAYSPENEEGTGPDYNEARAMRQTRTGWER